MRVDSPHTHAIKFKSTSQTRIHSLYPCTSPSRFLHDMATICAFFTFRGLLQSRQILHPRLTSFAYCAPYRSMGVVHCAGISPPHTHTHTGTLHDGHPRPIRTLGAGAPHTPEDPRPLQRTLHRHVTRDLPHPLPHVAHPRGHEAASDHSTSHPPGLRGPLPPGVPRSVGHTSPRQVHKCAAIGSPVSDNIRRRRQSLLPLCSSPRFGL